VRNDLIRAVLDCGVDDLSMLDDSGADMFKVVEQMRFEGLEITLNGIMAEIFREGIFRMSEAVKETRKRLEDEEDAGTLTEAGYEQLGAIRQHDLNPQSDFTYYVNCLDTHLHCDSSKKKVYEEMFEQEMQDLSDYTGFNIEG
jgi:hypothetical protein